jgi:hypothetical protein
MGGRGRAIIQQNNCSFFFFCFSRGRDSSDNWALYFSCLIDCLVAVRLVMTQGRMPPECVAGSGAVAGNRTAKNRKRMVLLDRRRLAGASVVNLFEVAYQLLRRQGVYLCIASNPPRGMCLAPGVVWRRCMQGAQTTIKLTDETPYATEREQDARYE